MTIKLHYKNTNSAIAYDRLIDLLNESAERGNLSKAETLAIAANLIGKLLAMQDPSYDLDTLNTLIAENIALGYAQGRDLVLRNVEVKGTA